MHFLIIVTLAVIGASEAWDNDLTRDLYFTCPTHQAIYSVESQHIDQNPDDRYFAFHCRDFPSFFDYCYWTGFINSPTSLGLFSCGGNGVITGLHSMYDGKYHDRMWRFFCCGSDDYRVINPYQADKHMTINQATTHTVDSTHWYYGLFTAYDWYHYDRTWQYELASLLKI